MTTGADWADSARRLLDALRPPAEVPPADGRATAVPSIDPDDDYDEDRDDDRDEDRDEDRTAHGADCRWCPVCQAAAVLRGERPEVTAAVADILATTASVLRELAGEPVRPADAPATTDHGDDDRGPGPGSVQRIDIA